MTNENRDRITAMAEALVEAVVICAVCIVVGLVLYGDPTRAAFGFLFGVTTMASYRRLRFARETQRTVIEIRRLVVKKP